MLSDFHFARPLAFVIILPSNLSFKGLQTMPKLASNAIFFVTQHVLFLYIASKFNFEANLGSNGHPNGVPNGVQNRGHELAVRASVRVGASGRAKSRIRS